MERSPEFIYVLGSIGVDLDFVVKNILQKKYPNYGQILFNRLIVKQPTFMPHTTITSWPPHCVSEPFYSALQEYNKKFAEYYRNCQSFISTDDGNYLENDKIKFSLLKKLGYKITVIYVNVSLPEQIKNIDISNILPEKTLLISAIDNIGNNSRLRNNLPIYIQMADKYKEIKRDN